MKINDGQNGLDNQLQNFSLTLLPRTIKYRLASVEQFDLLSCKYKPINESIEMIKLLNSALESKLEKPNLPKLNVDILEQYWAMKKPNTLVGFKNIGNTNFINAVLQCLLQTSPLVGLMISNNHNKKCKTCGFCTYCTLEKIFTSILVENKPPALHKLAKNIRFIIPTSIVGKQADSHQFLEKIIQVMEDIGSKTVNRKTNTTDIFSIFGSFNFHEKVCQKCKLKHQQYTPNVTVSLDISKNDTLLDCMKEKFRSYDESVILPEDLDYTKCEQCFETKVKDFQNFLSLPKVLVIHLDRFGVPNQKIQKFLEFPLQLDVSEFVSSKSNLNIHEKDYSLFGMIVHTGNDINSGTFQSVIKDNNNNWFSVENEKVTPIKSKKLKSQQAYVLFYQQKSIETKENFNQFCQQVSQKEASSSQASKKRPLESISVQNNNNNNNNSESIVVETDEEEPKKKKKKVKKEQEKEKQKEKEMKQKEIIKQPVTEYGQLESLVRDSMFDDIDPNSTWESENSRKQEQLRVIRQTANKNKYEKTKTTPIYTKSDWDKELDKGKTKKIRIKKGSINSGNKFQVTHEKLLTQKSVNDNFQEPKRDKKRNERKDY